MPSPTSAPDSSNGTLLSPAQASFVYWLNGLAPVVTNIVTPVATYWSLAKKPNLKPFQKYNQQVNEVVRQFVSGTVGLIGYFGGGETTKGLLNLFGALFPERNQSSGLSESSKQVLMIVGGTAISFIGYALIRPKINSELIVKLLKQEETTGGRLGNAAATSGWMRRVQDWVDRTLTPNGQPNLSKTAWVSAGFLTAYLGSGALAIGLLKQLFQGEKKSSQPSEALKSTLPFTAAASPRLINPPLDSGNRLYFACKAQPLSHTQGINPWRSNLS